MPSSPIILRCTRIADTDFIVKFVPRSRGYDIVACRDNNVVDRLRVMRGPTISGTPPESSVMDPMMHLVRSIIRRHAFRHESHQGSS